MLDINLFREDKGNNPEIIRESQRRRFANVDLVDEIVNLDKEWRQRNYCFPCVSPESSRGFFFFFFFLFSLLCDYDFRSV